MLSRKQLAGYRRLWGSIPLLSVQQRKTQMTIREIRHYPSTVLTTKAAPVAEVTEDVLKLVGDLQETARAYRAEGLAANQVGVLLRVFVIRDQENDEYIACINPEIVGYPAQDIPISAMEGCLSFPGVNERIERSNTVSVAYLDESGTVVNRWLSGVAAVAFQHELDHLNGVLFTSRMGKLKKHLALKRVTTVKRKIDRQIAALDKQVATR